MKPLLRYEAVIEYPATGETLVIPFLVKNKGDRYAIHNRAKAIVAMIVGFIQSPDDEVRQRDLVDVLGEEAIDMLRQLPSTGWIVRRITLPKGAHMLISHCRKMRPGDLDGVVQFASSAELLPNANFVALDTSVWKSQAL